MPADLAGLCTRVAMHCEVQSWHHYLPAMRPSHTRFWSPVDYEGSSGDHSENSKPPSTYGTRSLSSEPATKNTEVIEQHGDSRPWSSGLPVYHPYMPNRPGLPRPSPPRSMRPAPEWSPLLVQGEGSGRGTGTREPSPGSPGQPSEWSAKYRDTHVLSEQKRRNNIKDGFDSLQAVLPSCPANATKADILRLARQRILDLEGTEGSNGQEDSELQSRLAATNSFVDLLKREYAALAKEKAALVNTMEQLQRDKDELIQQCIQLSKPSKSK